MDLKILIMRIRLQDEEEKKILFHDLPPFLSSHFQAMTITLPRPETIETVRAYCNFLHADLAQVNSAPLNPEIGIDINDLLDLEKKILAKWQELELFLLADVQDQIREAFNELVRSSRSDDPCKMVMLLCLPQELSIVPFEGFKIENQRIEEILPMIRVISPSILPPTRHSSPIRNDKKSPTRSHESTGQIAIVGNSEETLKDTVTFLEELTRIKLQQIKMIDHVFGLVLPLQPLQQDPSIHPLPHVLDSESTTKRKIKFDLLFVQGSDTMHSFRDAEGNLFYLISNLSGDYTEVMTPRRLEMLDDFINDPCFLVLNSCGTAVSCSKRSLVRVTSLAMKHPIIGTILPIEAKSSALFTMNLIKEALPHASSSRQLISELPFLIQRVKRQVLEIIKNENHPECEDVFGTRSMIMMMPERDVLKWFSLASSQPFHPVGNLKLNKLEIVFNHVFNRFMKLNASETSDFFRKTGN